MKPPRELLIIHEGDNDRVNREAVLRILREEMALARTKFAGGKTSRLTSAYMRILNLPIE